MLSLAVRRNLNKSLIAISGIILFLGFQNCGPSFSVDGKLSASPFSSSADTLADGNLKLSGWDVVGPMEFKLTRADKILSGRSYILEIQAPEGREPSGAPQWSIQSNPSSACSLSPSPSGVETDKVLLCSTPASAQVFVEYSFNDGGSASESVTANLAIVSPATLKEQGAQLYANNCLLCHGSLQNSQKLDATADQISEAILVTPQMAIPTLLGLKAAELHALAAALDSNLQPGPSPTPGPTPEPTPTPTPGSTPGPTPAPTPTPPTINGASLYTMHCASCHRSIAVRVENSEVQGRSASQITNAIATRDDMRSQPALRALTPAEIQAISDALK